MVNSTFYIETNINEIIKAVNNKAEAALVGLKTGLKKAGVIVETKAREYFKTGGPGGSWPKLKASTRRIKASRGKDKGILIETTGLLHSLTTQQFGFETIVGTSKKYGKFHEQIEHGYRNIPARPFLRPAAQETGDEQKEAVMEAIRKEADI